jgi:SsrA-binding protein
MAKGKNKKDQNLSPRIVNRRARRDYEVLDSFEVGIVLRGSEVKSIREGRVQITEAFAKVDSNRTELYLFNMEISAYLHAHGGNGHDKLATRKLLAHRRQIKRLEIQCEDRGVTLIPLTLYFNDRGVCKIELGVCKGRKSHDKREDIKDKHAKRDMQRLMSKRV